MQTRICSQCETELELTKDNFYFRKNGRLASGRCISCCKKIQNAIRHKDEQASAEFKQRNAQYYQKHRDSLLPQQIAKQNTITENGLPVHRELQIKRTYGITGQEYKKLLEDCNSKCMICDNPLIFNTKNTHIDHCHNTGKVRGILCCHCNRGLGGFRDNPDILRKAISYLQRFL